MSLLGTSTFLAKQVPSGGGVGYQTYNRPDNPAYNPPFNPATNQQAMINSANQAGMQSSLEYNQALGQPTMELLNQQAGQLAGQFGMGQAAFDAQRAALMQGAAADAAGVSLGPQYDAITRAANNRQIAGLSDLDKLAFQALGNTFEGFDIQRTQAGQSAREARTAAEVQAYRNHLGARSDATSRGALGGRGIKRTYKDITQDLKGRLKSADETLYSQMMGINQQQDAATFGAQEQQMGRREQQAQLADRNKMLDIKAQEYGVDRSKISANLAQGLAKLGLDQYMDTNRIMDALSSNDLQQRSAAEQIFRQALEMSPMFTTLPPSPTITGNEGNPITQTAVGDYIGHGATDETYHP